MPAKNPKRKTLAPFHEFAASRTGKSGKVNKKPLSGKSKVDKQKVEVLVGKKLEEYLTKQLIKKASDLSGSKPRKPLTTKKPLKPGTKKLATKKKLKKKGRKAKALAPKLAAIKESLQRAPSDADTCFGCFGENAGMLPVMHVGDQLEHLQERSKYPEHATNPCNLALTCAGFNKRKSEKARGIFGLFVSVPITPTEHELGIVAKARQFYYRVGHWHASRLIYIHKDERVTPEPAILWERGGALFAPTEDEPYVIVKETGEKVPVRVG